MESKAELFHHGHNPYYFETFSDEQCARVLFGLEILQTPYTRVPHQDNDVRSLRFYLKDRASLVKLHQYLDNAHPSIGKGDAYAKYELVYENSFI